MKLETQVVDRAFRVIRRPISNELCSRQRRNSSKQVLDPRAFGRRNLVGMYDGRNTQKGQSQYDPRTDRETDGQFESHVRFELTK